MTVEGIMTLLQYQRAQMTSLKRSRTAKRSNQVPSYPIASEKSYKSRLTANFDAFSTELKSLLSQFMVTYENASDDDLYGLLNDMNDLHTIYFGNSLDDSPEINALLLYASTSVLNVMSTHVSNQLNVISGGLKLTLDTPWWESVQKTWMNTNYSYINSMGSELVKNVNTTVTNAVYNSLSPQELNAQVDKLVNQFSSFSVRRLARDQIGTLNSLTQKGFYTSLGMTTYHWITSADEHVRGNPSGKYSKAIPSHYVMENLLCSWNDSTIYSVDNGKTWLKKTALMEPKQVGMAIQCRCVASASWNGFVYKLDRG